jgi:tRNA(Met) cytidine acetyltransferase
MEGRQSDDPAGQDALARLTGALFQAARASFQRRCLVLGGDPDWCRGTAQRLLGTIPSEDVAWFSGHAPPQAWKIDLRAADSVLGRECTTAVFDAHDGFHPDGFGAISGSIRGGGLLLILAPPADRWPGFADPACEALAVHPWQACDVSGRYLYRLVRQLRGADGVTWVEQGGPVPTPPGTPARNCQPAQAESDDACRTEDQARAVEAIVHVLSGHRRRPLVLTSDRGRGKSSALGIAAARLLAQGTRRIVVTAHRREATEPVFARVRALLPEAQGRSSALGLQGRRLEFLPPDVLAERPQPADLVLVDEAAVIPAPLLERLLRRYPRIVFATTLHGYEGSGRGFAVRFQSLLEEVAPGWSAQRLEQSVRWAADDPLERLTFRALLLDAEPAPDKAIGTASADTCTLEALDRDVLNDDEFLLRELFGLLVLAHYRTRPADLRHLLDGPNLCVYAALHSGHVVGTALVAAEGGFDAPTAHEIWAGRRRPRGHLLAQSLAAHVGQEEAAKLSCARIVRIAVHPAVRGRGIGKRLLQFALERARAQGLDLAGSSFGATAGLLDFWRQSNFHPVRLGSSRGAASGAHSALLLAAVSESGKRALGQARRCFESRFPLMLADPLRYLDPGLAATLLLRAEPLSPSTLTPKEWREVAGFANARRSFDVSLPAIRKLALVALSDPGSCGLIRVAERDLMVARIVQHKPWSELAKDPHPQGRAEVTESLRRTMATLLTHYTGADSHSASAEPDTPPRRIVCLTEETTETLYLLGEQDRIVGISGFTVRPARARKEKPKVCAFTSAKIERILALQPDLVLGFSDLQADIAAQLVRHGLNVMVFNHRSVQEILDMILLVGRLVGAGERARTLVDSLASGVTAARERASAYPHQPRVYFEEWDNPMISAIRWVSELIEAAGGRDCFPELAQQPMGRDRIIADPSEVVRRKPDIIVGSWCGRKFRAEKVASRDGWDIVPAVKSGDLYEIKSAQILQPGPAALGEGLEQLQTIIAGWVERHL